jgi:hydrogenase maturation protease
MGEAPGAIRRFTPADVRAVGADRPSIHEPDLLAVLRLARQLGEGPDEVVFFGIQPEQVAPGVGLSAALEARIGEYEAAVAAELAAVD